MMMIRLFVLTGIALLTLTSVGAAQSAPTSSAVPHQAQDIDEAISNWAAGHDEIITPSARRAVFLAVARAQAQTQTSVTEGHKCRLNPQTGVQECAYWGAENVVASARDIVLFSMQKFPTIILNIRPIPPKDYIVKINSDNCDFSGRQN